MEPAALAAWTVARPGWVADGSARVVLLAGGDGRGIGRFARVLAAELDKAVEIDSYPDRQDLSLDLIKLAKKAGCRISIGTDSHGPSQLRFIDFGLAAAKLGGIDPDRILNFMTRDELLNWAATVREKAA